MRAQLITEVLLEGEQSGEHLDVRQYFLSLKPEEDPEALNHFKRSVAGYIKWIDSPDPEAGYLPDHAADLRALRQALDFEEAVKILAKYEDEELPFLYMIRQGYFI